MEPVQTSNYPPAEAIVHIVDDDEAVRSSLKFLMRSQGFEVECYPSAQDFLNRVDVSVPGCVLLDVRMPGMTGLELLEELVQRQMPVPVILMTGQADVPMAVRALKSGAYDFIEKPFDNRALLLRIREALIQGGDVHERHKERETINERLQRLTRREQEVMDMLVSGKPNKVIAADLGISTRTVEIHRAKIMEKLQARSLSDVVRIALTPA